MRSGFVVVFALVSTLAIPHSHADEVPKSQPAAVGAGPKLHVSKRSLAMLETDPKLAREINAGVIARAELRAELARGIAQFLRQVRTEPAFERGRFAGWRVLELWSKRPEIRVSVLRVGDTVVRVNGKSLERPENFKTVWDGLEKATELVLDIRRDAQSSKLRYTIAD